LGEKDHGITLLGKKEATRHLSGRSLATALPLLKLKTLPLEVWTTTTRAAGEEEMVRNGVRKKEGGGRREEEGEKERGG
jgi:hypothetical protein